MRKQGLGLILGLFVLFSPAYAEVSPESIIQIYQRLDNLEKEARTLQGENEVLKHQLDQLKKIQKEGFLNVDERIDELTNSIKSKDESEKKANQGTEQQSSEKKNESNNTNNTDVESNKAEVEGKTAEKPATSVPQLKKEDEQAEPTVKTDQSDTKKPVTKKNDSNARDDKKSIREPTAYEKETYQAAFNKMNSSPTAATRSFEEYIKMQPDSPLAANAQYWIGEIKYSHNNYKGAVQEFIKVLQKYKYSSKAPDAAIKLGYSFYALKNWTYARRTFEDVLKYFPENKNAVNLATKRLEMMKAAGH
jgi:tol-pal system protein YbgF